MVVFMVHGRSEYMATLVIHAPRWRESYDNAKSFQSTLLSGIGEDYAISKQLFAQLDEGCRVVLLSKDQKLRAEGRLDKLVPTKKARNGIQRYNVHIKNLQRVEYQPERLNRNGIAVI